MKLAVKSSSVCKKYCCVPQCPSKVTRERLLSFHRFPKIGRKISLKDDHGQKEEHELKDLWARQLKITKPATSSMIVCSRHFTRADFILPDSPTRKRFCLKRSAIPSQNLPTKCSKTNVTFRTDNCKAKGTSVNYEGSGRKFNFQPDKGQGTSFEHVSVPEQNSVHQEKYLTSETSDSLTVREQAYPSGETLTNFENLKIHIKKENEGEVNGNVENVNPFTAKESMCFFPADVTSIKTEPIEEVNVDELCSLDKDVNVYTLRKEEEDPIRSHDCYFVNGTFIKLEKPENAFDAGNLKDVNNAADQKIQHSVFNSVTELEEGTSAEQGKGSLLLNIKLEKTNEEDEHFHIQQKKSVERLKNVTGSKCEASLKCQQDITKDNLKPNGTRLTKEDKIYKCDVCARPFKRLSSLKCHLSYHSEEYMYECNLCPERFKRIRDLQDHSLSHEKQLYKCKICSRLFKRQCDLKQHSVIHSPKKLYDKSYKSKPCGKLFLKHGGLNAHDHIHKNAQHLKCEICGRMFRLQYSLMRHQRTHDSKPKKSLVLRNSCLKLNTNLLTKPKICNITSPFPSVNTLKAKNQPQECKLCGKILASISALRSHIQVHTGERPYECNFCNKNFVCSISLQKHLRIHTGYRCNVCKRSFKYARTFKYHVLTHEDSTLKCTECSKRFKTKSELQKHIGQIHKNSHECLLCGESYADLSGLHKHVCQAIQKCAVCGISCKSLKMLKSHILLHTDETPYK